MPTKILFLPGALGRTQLWEPVANLIPSPAQKIHIGWPGFGSTPPDPDIRGIDDLVVRVVAQIDQPTALIAQSMGGVIAIRAALAKPDLVTHLVLAVTSGGLDVSSLGGRDWRPEFHRNNPFLPRWFSTYQEDLSDELHKVTIPTLLLWGDSDPISPVSVGKQLASSLPQARLHILEGGDHDLAEVHAAEVAALIRDHLSEFLIEGEDG